MVSDEMKQKLSALSFRPFMSREDMAVIHRWGLSPLRRQLIRAEKRGWVARVPHALEGRNATQRYHLTGDGVILLAETIGQPTSEVMDRPGATGYGLATYHRLIDILAGVYKTGRTIARCYSSPDDLCIYPLSAGPLDAVIRIRNSPYSLGVIVYRPALSLKYFETKIREYARAGEDRPSVLLVVSPDRMAEHTVARLVALNYAALGQTALAAIAPLETLGDPDARIWRLPHRYDDDRARSMRTILNGTPKSIIRDFVPQVEPYRRAALPRTGWRGRPDLTRGERRALYAIADWPLANERFVAALAGLKPTTLPVKVRALRARGLVRYVSVREGDECLVLTDAGIVYVCSAARADYDRGKELWSAETRPDGTFRGTDLRTLRREGRHTDMVYDIVGRFLEGAAALVDVSKINVRPAHKAELSFRPDCERDTRHLKPDALIDMELDGTRHVLLLEAERTRLSRQRMGQRLNNYASYFDTDWSRLDYPTRPLIAVVLTDPGLEANFSVAQVDAGKENAKVTHLPTIITNMSELGRSQAGPFDPVWRRPGDYGQRHPFYALTG